MRLENCLEDMSVISNALATVTSAASRFSNAENKHKQVMSRKPLNRFRNTVKRSAKFVGIRAQDDYEKTAGISVQESDTAAQLTTIEQRLAEL